jgi:hypothetical protein
MRLGDFVEKLISVITLGQGKRIATYIAKLRGKEDCGCNRRQKKLNKLNIKEIFYTKKYPTPPLPTPPKQN